MLSGALVGLVLCLGCSSPTGSRGPAQDETSLEIAELALARGEFAQAVRQFELVLKHQPGHRRALLGSARANLIARRGEASLARFAAYRQEIDGWKKVDHWEYCAAIVLGAEQAIESGVHPRRALELAQRLETEKCADGRSRDLILRSGLQVAELARSQGRDARSLEIYLWLVSQVQGETPKIRIGMEESVVARAYLGASEILVHEDRREDALALLSGGLDKFPSNRDLVHRMLTVLADGSSVVFPREETLEESIPAAPK
jgi:tetratricopeptide (TPR) repeat protein